MTKHFRQYQTWPVGISRLSIVFDGDGTSGLCLGVVIAITLLSFGWS